MKTLTVLSILPGYLGHSITDFISHGTVDVRSQGFEEFLPDGCGLVVGKGEKHVECLAPVILASFRSNASEDDCCERTNLKLDI